MPNSLLVNESEHEQAVRKYLIKEAKTGQSSLMDNNIKNNLCVDFILKPYKSFIINELSEFFFDNNIPLDDHLNRLSNIFGNILEKTCSTLTNFKSIFNISSHLSHSVSDMMQSSCIDKYEHNVLISNSRINDENSDEVMKNNPSNLSLNKPNICTTRILRSQNKHKTDANYLNSNISISSNLVSKPKVIIKKLTVTKKQLNKSNVSSVINNMSSNETNIYLVKGKIVDTEHLLKDNDSDDGIVNTKMLRNQKILMINKVKYLTNILLIIYYK